MTDFALPAWQSAKETPAGIAALPPFWNGGSVYLSKPGRRGPPNSGCGRTITSRLLAKAEFRSDRALDDAHFRSWLAQHSLQPLPPDLSSAPSWRTELPGLGRRNSAR